MVATYLLYLQDLDKIPPLEHDELLTADHEYCREQEYYHGEFLGLVGTIAAAVAE